MDVPIDYRPIAIFDSGLGGLTVVRELRRRLPQHHLVYFGDTARVPYGTKSAEAVTRFTGEIVRFLLRFDPCCIVAACNTASAVAVPTVARGLDVPLISVVLPGAQDAASAARDGQVVAVIATTATISSNAYRNALNRLNPALAVVQKACPLFVPLVEEGRRPDDALVRMAVREYLEPIRRLHPSVVVLACTHYPMLKPAIGDFLGPETALIDSATSTARHVESLTREMTGPHLSAPPPPVEDGSTRALRPSGDPGRLLCYVSDNPQQFQSIGSRMLGEPITDVVRVCPEEFAALVPTTGETRQNIAV
jgi:glutamate racemase